MKWDNFFHQQMTIVQYIHQHFINFMLPGQIAGHAVWSVQLDPLEVSTGPYTITAKLEGHNTISLHDVLVGDVWVCSGQSNMQFTVPMVSFQ